MPTDDINRDKLYSAPEEDDDFEYELEPPDPAIADAEKRRAAEVENMLKKSIDIDEVYRDMEARRDSEILEQWAQKVGSYRFQFQIKHLLILTAVIAVLLTLRQLGIPLITFFVVGFMLFIGALTLYLQWHERKRQAEADRRRERMYAERRAALGRGPLPPASLPPDELETARHETAASTPYRFRFSMYEFMIAVTCAAILLGIVQMLGGPSNAAAFFGLFAVAGLAIHAMGYEPPEVVAFTWWIMLMMYVGLSIISFLWAVAAG